MGGAVVRTGATVVRNPLDVKVNPVPPGPLALTRPISRSPTQNQFLQQRIADLRKEGAGDFRVDQHQVNVNGERVGINRPDLQYTINGKRHYEEFDTPSSGRGPAHESRIKANDPYGIVRLWIVK